MKKVLFLAALLAGPASAQTVTIDASVKFPPIVQTAANLVDLLSQGVKVSFLTPTQQPAATLSKTGGIQLTGKITEPQPVTQVQVSTPIAGTNQVVQELYGLLKPLDLKQPISAQSIVVKAKDGQTVPLLNVMGRQAAWAKAPGLQKKPAGMPPGQLKKLCKQDPKNALCSGQPNQGGKGHKH